jgi:hypothetical protein
MVLSRTVQLSMGNCCYSLAVADTATSPLFTSLERMKLKEDEIENDA